MKHFLIIVVLAGLGYLGFRAIRSGSFQAGLSRVADLPGVTISKLSFTGGNLIPMLLVIGGVVLVLFVIYIQKAK